MRFSISTRTLKYELVVSINVKYRPIFTILEYRISGDFKNLYLARYSFFFKKKKDFLLSSITNFNTSVNFKFLLSFIIHEYTRFLKLISTRYLSSETLASVKLRITFLPQCFKFYFRVYIRLPFLTKFKIICCFFLIKKKKRTSEDFVLLFFI